MILNSALYRIAILGVPLLLFGTLILIMTTPSIPMRESLSLAVSLDLVVCIPLIYYLLIRKTNIPALTVFPVMITGLLIGNLFFTKENLFYLDYFENWILPLIEVFVVAFIALKARNVLKKIHSETDIDNDFFSALQKVTQDILPRKISFFFAIEIAVLYYGFFNWSSKQLRENEFSCHTKSGTPSMFWGLIFLIIVETVAVHFLLSQWNHTAAWILTGLSCYTLIQFFGFARSLSKRPIQVGSGSLRLRYGIMAESKIPLASIDEISLSGKLPDDAHSIKLSPFDQLESPNVIIHLKRQETLVGLYGRQKDFKSIGFRVDEPKKFINYMEKIIHIDSR